MDLKILAYSSLLCYCAAQWPPYQITPLHAKIAEHLEAVERGEITRLLLNVPPRHGKTLLVGINFPAWFLGRNPEREVIYSSYSGERAEDVGREVRNQIQDPLHGRIFKECSISSDSASVKKISIGQKGAYYAVGVGGPITGRGANCFIIDDPIKDRQEADSKARRKFIKNWYQGVAYTRLQPENAIILIQHRWHDDDLAGWLLREHQHENWTVLRFPAIAEEEDILGRKPGDALWPEAYPAEVLKHTKKSVQTREWSALYQQRPMIAEGSVVNLNWFRRYNRKDGIKEKTIRTVQSWDTAYKKGELNSPSVCTTWKVTKLGYYLWDVFRKKMEYPELKRKVVTLQRRYEADAVLIEDKASGQSLIQEFRLTSGMPVIRITPVLDKVTRMSVESAKIEAGKVFIPEEGTASWLVDFESEIGVFPYAANLDQADSLSQFLAWIGKRKIRSGNKRRFWK
jgi:predicted phage terminase large subunit-like protein